MLRALRWIGFGTYCEWSLIHILAGSMSLATSLKQDVHGYLTGICGGAPQNIKDDAKNRSSWNAMNIRILIQHALNLLFVGFAAMALAVLVAKNEYNRYSYYFGLWPFFTDIGYFYAIDTVSFGETAGEIQTVIVSIAQITTAIIVHERFPIGPGEYAFTLALPIGLILAAIINKVRGATSQVGPSSKSHSN